MPVGNSSFNALTPTIWKFGEGNNGPVRGTKFPGVGTSFWYTAIGTVALRIRQKKLRHSGDLNRCLGG